MHGVYIASRTRHAKIWRDLRASGAPIISSWIDLIDDSGADAAEENFSGLWGRILTEIGGANGLVLYAEPNDFPFRGAFIEAGMAMMAGIPVNIVAPGVDLDAHGRPLGTWIKHSLVSLHRDVPSAIASI